MYRLVLLLTLLTLASAALIDITDQLFRHNTGGVIAAFGDFNGDTQVDIFVVDHKGSTVDLLVASKDELMSLTDPPYDRLTLIQSSYLYNDTVITSIMPGDFDGDARLDLLLTRQDPDDKTAPYIIQIYWGFNDTAVSPPVTFEQTVVDEPLLFDYNADMLPDILAETERGKRTVWLASDNRNFTMLPFNEDETGTAAPFRKPNSNAFLDLNGDFNTDLMISTETGYEMWLNVDGQFLLNETISLPGSFEHVGQSVFADFDMDNSMDHVVPVCMDEKCENSLIYVYSRGQWEIFAETFLQDKKAWGFVPPAEVVNDMNLPITLRVGDFNIDGYQDIIAVLQNYDGEEKTQTAFLLTNEKCQTRSCMRMGRTLIPDWNTPFSKVSDAVIGAFYDVYENGVLDLLLVSMTSSLTNKDIKTPHIRAYRNEIEEDACFVKVTVTSGLCSTNCPGNRNAFRVNQPGPTIQYTTTRTDGSPQHMAASQLSQSAHYALQLPFTVFGLGQTPNFLDTLTVGIPSPSDEIKRKRTWTSVIPNSQLIIEPYPNDKPSQWKNRLFVTPSRLILFTGAALLGACGFMAILVGILHWRELREDALEKKIEAHKFHFDAM